MLSFTVPPPFKTFNMKHLISKLAILHVDRFGGAFVSMKNAIATIKK